MLWLEPYPDAQLEGIADEAPGPEARYESVESISLAFITASQLLPSRQRAVLILRDVLGFPASETARILDTTEESVTSALKRARAALRRQEPGSPLEPPPLPGSPAEQELVARLVDAYQRGDVAALVALLTDDVVVSMPPVPLEYQGRELAAQFSAIVTFRQGRTYDLVPTRANGELAFGAYLHDPRGGARHAMGLLVFTLTGSRVRAITRFDNSVLPHFGLPRTLPG
jgi:RNA polymerase sigma-70 factor (TIGR02960 family)